MVAVSCQHMPNIQGEQTLCIGRRGRIAVLLAMLLLLGALAAPPVQASFDFRASFVANKVVRSWFHKQDGVQVWNILEKLNHNHTRQLWEKVDSHPYVQEVKDALHGQRQMMLYHGLRRTFLDRLHSS